MSPQSVYRSLSGSVLSTGRPSAQSEQVLRRLGLAERFEKEPATVLAELRGSGADLSRERTFALAELSFAHAEGSGQREYYLAAAVYAYAYLFPSRQVGGASPVDPRMSLAADLYNLGLTQGLSTPPGGLRVQLEAGERPLPFGRLALAIDPAQLHWGGYRMSRFIPVAEFEVRGLRNRYRQPGVGAPLAAELTPLEEGPAGDLARRHIPPRIKVPVTAFVRIENVEEAIATGHATGRIEVYPADVATAVSVDGQAVPLELEPTATLAYLLEGSRVWDTEIGGFLSADRRPFPEGLVMLHPYRAGRTPVVLVHGTASSPARWADMVNELQNDPVLRERIQFWFFTYNTSNPILLSARELRDSLRRTLADIDPGGRDPALRRMVLIGHSQGGVLARLMVTDSGTRFWDAAFDVPLSELRVTPANRELLQATFFFEPLPFVTSVVFIATPHRGSFRVSTFFADIIQRLVTLPVTAVKGVHELVEQNPDVTSLRAFRRLPTAVDNMRPGHRFIRTLSVSPIAGGVTAHSIIAVQGEGPISSRTDGVVAYESARLDGVASEKIVLSGHSAQGEPATIQEVRRILREQLAAEVR